MAEITVNDFQELKQAITDATSTVIHLGGPITFSSGGIIVPKTKGNIVIDGHGFTVTDLNSAGYDNTIHFIGTTGPDITITLRNAVWNGRNWYGMIYTYETSSNSNITIIFDNIRYTGPQPIHNRFGITRVVNSSFSIELNGASYITSSHEFAEANRLIIEGNVTVNSNTTGYSVIYFPTPGASLTVEENAVFNVITTNYMFYNELTNQPVMTFKKDSATNIQTKYGLFWDSSINMHIADSFMLESGASFVHTQSDRRLMDIPSFKCRNSFVIEEGSIFHLFMPSQGTSPLMYFGNPTTISFNNPKSVILYNNGGNVVQFAGGTSTSPNKITIDTELINRWIMAKSPLSAAGGFDDLPARAFAKADGSNVKAMLNATTNTILWFDSTIETTDTGYPMDSLTFNIFQTQVLSMGRLNINLDEIYDISAAITGITEAFANIKAAYDNLTLLGTTDSGGIIHLTISTPIPAGTTVDFAVNWNFLTKQITPATTGSIRITHLPNLPFQCFAVPYRKSIVKRKDSGWYMEVTDTRINGGSWYLYASLSDPMRSESAALDDNLLFYEGTSGEIISSNPVLIKQGTSPPVLTRITWAELEGFLLKVNPDFLYQEGHYVGRITWKLRDTPL